MPSLRAFFTFLLTVVALAACAGHDDVVQRATQGPTADEVYRARFARNYGRGPSFDEMTAWRGTLEGRVTRYLNAHPEISTSPRASQFRFERRVAVGMSMEEVVLLVDVPENRTSDPGEMKTAAAQFWPAVGKRAQQMWSYPPGWQFYFEGHRLVDITVRGRRPIE
ncbi:MAG: hypothetical protein L0027_11025 [Candidatus Rokubacteria bacterium]|nr:hypothetical protein [Candidatus Rokubacteria bacterium]